MNGEYFVNQNSIVRKIWGNSDTILFVFAGASAEFALSKAVDWLYFTGKLPSDPLGRLFSTVTYARKIIFSDQQTALKAIDTIVSIHKGVENLRANVIPQWAYRHVLFLLIDYSIRSFELLERPLSAVEKQEVFNVFYRFGNRMGIEDLPHTLEQWEKMRQNQLNENLQFSRHTKHLFGQYRKHLGFVRYKLLLELQILLVPQSVGRLLGFRKFSLFKPLIFLYKLSKQFRIDWFWKNILFPAKYKNELKALDSSLQPIGLPINKIKGCLR